MTSSPSLIRHSARSKQQPTRLADEQANEEALRLEQKAIHNALIASLQDSWEDDESKTDDDMSDEDEDNGKRHGSSPGWSSENPVVFLESNPHSAGGRTSQAFGLFGPEGNFVGES